MVKRPIHRGISDFALWALVKSRTPAILDGRKVVVHEAKPNIVKGDGWYVAWVSDENSSTGYFMDITTAEFEQKRQHMAERKKRHKEERRKRNM